MQPNPIQIFQAIAPAGVNPFAINARGSGVTFSLFRRFLSQATNIQRPIRISRKTKTGKVSSIV